MRLVQILALMLALALAVTIYLGVSLYYSNQELNSELGNLNQSMDDLNHRLSALNQSYVDLSLRFSSLNPSHSQILSDLSHFNSQLNQSSVFLTPISKSRAISIALAYGGWNASSLRDQFVTATLQYYGYNSSGGAWWISDVTGPVADYSPVQEGTITYRYVWTVMLANSGPYPLTHTGYEVDASNGQMLGGMITDVNPGE